MHILPVENGADLPETFTDPFRYAPHPLVRKAADELIGRIESSSELSSAFSEGKMVGVLIVSDKGGNIGYLAAFSGNAGGRSNLEGFVPPIYDLLSPDGYFKREEARITHLNHQIAVLEGSEGLARAKDELEACLLARDEETGLMKARMAVSKRERDYQRSQTDNPSELSALIRESQHEKAEFRRLRLGWEERISLVREELKSMEEEIRWLKEKRAAMSDELQKWIFSRYIVHNACGEEKSIGDIFADAGLVPPGGTGECAAPKLLEHAYRNGFRPLAMGEFWYGTSPSAAVRTHGHFYPSCTSKCGPLLGFMMKGLAIEKATQCHEIPEVIFEDELITAVSKPSGMPSVPGLDGRKSAFEIIMESHGELHTVHRLDMDTSGIILFAKTAEAAADLQRQFEEHSIRKTYMARLSHATEGKPLKTGDKGRISLPLSPDYDERPRQKVDQAQGKPSDTIYEVVSENRDGSIDVIFHPLTGRTHQLRVHSSHILGLGHPIVGDLLYGGSPASRLHLHAAEITFRNPATGTLLSLTAPCTF